MDINILSETEIEVFNTPNTKIKQQVITYQVPGFAPHTIWLDNAKLPDIAWRDTNPGKITPADIVAKGDAVRRAAIEADMAMIAKKPKGRSI